MTSIRTAPTTPPTIPPISPEDVFELDWADVVADELIADCAEAEAVAVDDAVVESVPVGR